LRGFTEFLQAAESSAIVICFPSDRNLDIWFRAGPPVAPRSDSAKSPQIDLLKNEAARARPQKGAGRSRRPLGEKRLQDFTRFSSMAVQSIPARW